MIDVNLGSKFVPLYLLHSAELQRLQQLQHGWPLIPAPALQQLQQLQQGSASIPEARPRGRTAPVRPWVRPQPPRVPDTPPVNFGTARDAGDPPMPL